jgi:phosphoribosylanthranilate isomerase
MIVQIYEIQIPHEGEKCILLGVDRLGSVLLSEEEWKRPEIRDVIRLSQGTQTQNSLIPLFQTRNTLYRAMDYYRPHFIHFCESLTDNTGHMLDLTPFIRLQREFKQKFPEIPIIRTLPVPEQKESAHFPVLDIAKSLESVTDVFLIDTWIEAQPVEGFIGITGRQAERETARNLVLESALPVILAGGLSPDNVYDAALEVMPAGADSCSHTNIVNEGGQPVRFRKDFTKVESFVREVRRAEAELLARRKELEKRLHTLKLELQDREAALPAHSIRPHQIQLIEEIEERIASVEKELKALRWI